MIVDTQEGPTNDPMKMVLALSSYWDGIEGWPSLRAEAYALEMLHDHYSFFRPFRHVVVHLTGKHLEEQLSSMQPCAPGLDGNLIAVPQSLTVGGLRFSFALSEDARS